MLETLHSLARDGRYAVRALRKSPGPSIRGELVLAVGRTHTRR